MKLKLLFAAVMVSVATVISASAMSNVTKSGGLATTVENQRDMLAVSAADTINIKVTGVTGSLTLLSYKNGQEPTADNIQYIRQYTPDSEGEVNVSFKIRSIIPKNGSNTENGLYCVKLNDGANKVTTLYYKVGKPVAVTDDGVKYYQRVDFTSNDKNNIGAGTFSLAYKANFKLNGGVVNQYGFTASYDSGTEQSTVEDDIEFSGAGDFSFGVTIHGIPNDTDISKLKVVPFVNYAVNNSAVEE